MKRLVIALGVLLLASAAHSRTIVIVPVEGENDLRDADIAEMEVAKELK